LELIVGLSRSDNVDLRRTAIYALADAPGIRVDELVALASHDTDRDCRIYAIQALSRLSSRAAVSPLEELLKRETDELVRTNILRALQSID
jgi:HEAT repeat protein